MENKELIFSVTRKDFEITHFSGSGAGGQHRNKHQNCVRIKHKETGIITTGQEERSLKQNEKNAFLRMTEHLGFKNWLRLKIAEAVVKNSGAPVQLDIGTIVEEQMKSSNLKIEIKDEKGEWIDDGR